MDINDLKKAEQDALHSMLRYLAEHWDWEYPTLYGLQHNEAKEVFNGWPQSVTHDERACSICALPPDTLVQIETELIRRHSLDRIAAFFGLDAQVLQDHHLNRRAAVALHAAMRVCLEGNANPAIVPQEKVKEITGLSWPEAVALREKLAPRFEAAGARD